MAIGNIYLVTAHIFGPERPWTMSFGYKQTSGGNDSGTLQALAEAMAPLFDDGFTNILSFDHVVLSFDAEQVDTGDDIPGQAPMLNGEGNVQEVSLPNTNPVLVNWRTIAPNAKFNGKTYISGIPITYVTNGLVTGFALPFIQAWVDGMLVDIDLTGDQDATFTPVVISRVEDGVNRPQPIGYEIEVGSVNVATKNQRRRRTSAQGVPA